MRRLTILAFVLLLSTLSSAQTLVFSDDTKTVHKANTETLTGLKKFAGGLEATVGITFPGSVSGVASLVAPAAAGSPTIVLPSTAGTLTLTTQVPTIQIGGVSLNPASGPINFIAGSNITLTPVGNNVTVSSLGGGGGGSGSVTNDSSLATNFLVLGGATATAVKPDLGCSTDGAGALTCVSLVTSGFGPDVYTPIADGTTANSMWLSSTSANKFKAYVGSFLKVFAFTDDNITGTSAGITGKSLQGNGAIIPTATGSPTSGKQVMYDVSGNLVPSSFDVGLASTNGITSSSAGVQFDAYYQTITEQPSPAGKCDANNTTCASGQGSIYINSTTHKFTCEFGPSGTDCLPILTASEFDNGTCTTSKTIDPVNGLRQRVTLTNAQTCALTFTQPSGKTALIQVKVIQSSAGSFNGTISGGKWPSGTVPTITATSAAIDLLSCYLDGTNTYCNATKDFR